MRVAKFEEGLNLDDYDFIYKLSRFKRVEEEYEIIKNDTDMTEEEILDTICKFNFGGIVKGNKAIVFID